MQNHWSKGNIQVSLDHCMQQNNVAFQPHNWRKQEDISGSRSPRCPCCQKPVKRSYGSKQPYCMEKTRIYRQRSATNKELCHGLRGGLSRVLRKGEKLCIKAPKDASVFQPHTGVSMAFEKLGRTQPLRTSLWCAVHKPVHQASPWTTIGTCLKHTCCRKELLSF